MTLLSVDYDSLRREVGRHMFGGRSPSAWSGDTDKVSDVADAIRRGLASFYYPQLPDGSYYQWSFLSRSLSLAANEGQQSVSLPEDFCELSSAFVAVPDSGNQIASTNKLQRCEESDLRVLAAGSQATGVPRYYAIRVSDTSTGTNREIVLYPTPDQAVRIDCRYIVDPPTLDSSNTTPLGGPRVANAIILACLAAADQIANPEEGETLSQQKYQQALLAAIEADRSSYGEPTQQPWPLDEGLPANSLEINKAYLKRRIGIKMGYGPNPPAWTHRQAAEIAEALNTGLRYFYAPPVLPGDRRSHDWSFLKPIRQLTLVPGQYAYDLPDDFVDFEGPMTYQAGDGIVYEYIEIVGVQRVLSQLEHNLTSSRPTMAARQVRSTDPAFGTRYEAMFWPIPNEAVVVSYISTINPNRLGDDAELPLGGQPHAQAVLESCLYAAETIMPPATDEKGRMIQTPAYDRFVSTLTAAVSIDRRQSCPETLGRTRIDDPYDYIPGIEHHLQENYTLLGGTNPWV